MRLNFWLAVIFCIPYRFADAQGAESIFRSGFQRCDAGLYPEADAGPALYTGPGLNAVLDGSGSCDPDDLPLRFSWRLLSRPEGSSAELTNAGASATAPGPAGAL